MAGIKEIKNRIVSIEETKKITGAMYMIASNKMRKAKSCLDNTRPYFDLLRTEIKRIFQAIEYIDNEYIYTTYEDINDIKGTYAYLVITSDKGLAGAYNMNVIKQAQNLMKMHNDYKLFVVGEYGRRFFEAHNFEIEKSFLYTAQNPTFKRAREISALLLDMYAQKEITKIYVVYTDYGKAISSEVNTTVLLPFHVSHFDVEPDEDIEHAHFVFQPSVEDVLENIIPSYIAGYIYSALVDSFCCEQNARMTAMHSANTNAQNLLDDLKKQYNHIRQEQITQEITELSVSAKYQNKNTETKGGNTCV